MFLLSEMVKVLDLIRKEKQNLYAKVVQVCVENEFSVHEIVRKEKEIYPSFAFLPLFPQCVVIA